MIQLTVCELLMDLANDPEHPAAVSNLEACFLEPLERLTKDPALLDRVCEVRRCLAQAALSLRTLALVEVSE